MVEAFLLRGQEAVEEARPHHFGVAVRSERSPTFVGRLAIRPRHFPSLPLLPPVVLHEQREAFRQYDRWIHGPSRQTLLPWHPIVQLDDRVP